MKMSGKPGTTVFRNFFKGATEKVNATSSSEDQPP